ncbi:hypothetical protein MRB53_016582 [Persea americana]|uniref:Uncharacterized protein n=1 Tax=Persea americana TaxID=3435 RepID=A0ACC2M396_PERAE|nr:hypothetical protein MRB53_016582 [Persea americana]
MPYYDNYDGDLPWPMTTPKHFSNAPEPTVTPQILLTKGNELMKIVLTRSVRSRIWTMVLVIYIKVSQKGKALQNHNRSLFLLFTNEKREKTFPGLMGVFSPFSLLLRRKRGESEAQRDGIARPTL